MHTDGLWGHCRSGIVNTALLMDLVLTIAVEVDDGDFMKWADAAANDDNNDSDARCHPLFDKDSRPDVNEGR